jgi:hypothetical protein
MDLAAHRPIKPQSPTDLPPQGTPRSKAQGFPVVGESANRVKPLVRAPGLPGTVPGLRHLDYLCPEPEPEPEPAAPVRLGSPGRKHQTNPPGRGYKQDVLHSRKLAFWLSWAAVRVTTACWAARRPKLRRSVHCSPDLIVARRALKGGLGYSTILHYNSCEYAHVGGCLQHRVSPGFGVGLEDEYGGSRF